MSPAQMKAYLEKLARSRAAEERRRSATVSASPFAGLGIGTPGARPDATSTDDDWMRDPEVRAERAKRKG